MPLLNGSSKAPAILLGPNAAQITATTAVATSFQPLPMAVTNRCYPTGSTGTDRCHECRCCWIAAAANGSSEAPAILLGPQAAQSRS